MRKQQKNTENRKRKQTTKKKCITMGITQAGVWILLLLTLPPHQIERPKELFVLLHELPFFSRGWPTEIV